MTARAQKILFIFVKKKLGLNLSQHFRLLTISKSCQSTEIGFGLAKLGEANLSTVFISRIERDVESPSVDNLVKIAKALGVRVGDLVDGF